MCFTATVISQSRSNPHHQSHRVRLRSILIILYFAFMSFFPSLTAYTQITTAGCFLPSSPQAPLQGNVTLRLLRCSSPTSLSASVTEILLSRTSFLHPPHQRNTPVADCFRSPPSWRGYPALDPSTLTCKILTPHSS